MNQEIIAIIITSVLSTISLIVSIKTYVVNKPKIKISITDKESDVYFGTVCIKEDKVAPTKIGTVEINIINNSPVDIHIRDIRLKIGKHYHRHIDKNNSYWEDIYFFYLDNKGEKVWDGCGINYKEHGITIPTKIKSYSILTGICLFHDFPNTERRVQKGKIVLSTAVGKISKKVKFIKYDQNYRSSEMKDVDLFIKNQM